MSDLPNSPNSPESSPSRDSSASSHSAQGSPAHFSQPQKPKMNDPNQPHSPLPGLPAQQQTETPPPIGQGPQPQQPLGKRKAPEPLPENPTLWQLADSLLRRPGALTEYAQRDNKCLLRVFKATLLTLFCSLSLFGLVIGCFSTGHQLWQAPLKLLLIAIFSGVLCLPSLYIFSALSGKDLDVKTSCAAMLAILTRASLLLLAFVPIAWLFAVSIDSLAFYSVIVLIISLISTLIGLSFFASGRTGAGSGYLVLWAVVFLLVILQMPTSLRPIIANSPTFFPEEKRFFLVHWGEVLSGEFEERLEEKWQGVEGSEANSGSSQE